MGSAWHASEANPQDGQTPPNMPIDSVTFEELLSRRSFRVTIGNLHRCNILHTITKLVRHHATLLDENADIVQQVRVIDQLDTITEDLERYTKAVQNYRYWDEHPIVLGSQEYPVRNLAMLLVQLDSAKAQTTAKTSPELLQIQNDILKIISNQGPGGKGWMHDIKAKHEVRKKKQKEFFTRVAMALFGGAALIVPMLIMTLHPTKLTNLLTASVFVFVVSIALAWFMDEAQSKDIMAATAAYAAVLVVFVGGISSSG